MINKNWASQIYLFRFSPSEARTLDRGPPATETDFYKNSEFSIFEHYAMKLLVTIPKTCKTFENQDYFITFSGERLDRGQTPLAKSEGELLAFLSKHLWTYLIRYWLLNLVWSDMIWYWKAGQILSPWSNQTGQFLHHQCVLILSQDFAIK